MRKALIRRSERGVQTAVPTSIPAPIRGWNAREPLAAMAPEFAIVLDNWFPRTADVQFRRGATNWSTGFASKVESFLPYNGAATQKLFAAAGVGVFDVTAGGAIGAAAVAITNARFISTNIRTAGVSALYAVNGVDNPLYYDGTTWTSVTGVSTPALTGVTLNTLNYVALHQRRLWFVQEDSMSLWYLAVNSVGGALTQYPVGEIFGRGGSVTAIGTMTFDGGDGSDDYFVIVTSEGEVAFYRGIDPSSASSWSLVGVYYVGEPIGRRCLEKFGGDLLFLSVNGLAPLSKLLQSATINRSSQFSYNIENAFLTAAKAAGSLAGWEARVFPAEGAILVNIPVSGDVTFHQYVMNSITGAWCRFLGWNAQCFVVFGNELYFGGATTVAKAWTGLNDFDNNIEAYGKTAFNYFQTRGRQKQVGMVRPVLTTDNAAPVSIGLSVDFEDNTDFSTIASFGASFGVWDTGLWDTALWGTGPVVSQDWRSVAVKPGMCAAFRIAINTKGVDLAWISADYTFKLGAIL